MRECLLTDFIRKAVTLRLVRAHCIKAPTLQTESQGQRFLLGPKRNISAVQHPLYSSLFCPTLTLSLFSLLCVVLLTLKFVLHLLDNVLNFIQVKRDLASQHLPDATLLPAPGDSSAHPVQESCHLLQGYRRPASCFRQKINLLHLQWFPKKKKYQNTQ